MSAGGGKGGAQNPFQASATALQGAGAGTQEAFDAYKNLSGYDPALAGTAATVANPSTIASGIGTYMNPFEDAVIGAATNDVNRLTTMQQEANKASASAAGAFGSGRHGVVEAETNNNAARTLADMTAGLRQSGWNNAATLAGTDIANNMNVNTTNANSQNQFTLADSIAQNEASRFNSGVASTAAGGMGQMAAQAAGLGKDAFNIGTAISDKQDQQGALDQSLVQQVLNNAMGQFSNFTGQGTSLIDMIGSVLSGSPLNGNSTNTSEYQPGLFDYISLAAQTAGSALGGKGGTGAGKGQIT